jgi:RHS repeat-associated protein
VKRRFGYDGLDRLVDTRTVDDVALQTYTYDATGNRTALTERIPVFGGGTTTYQTVNHSYTYPANSHRLTAVNGVSRSYDAAGNLTQIGDAATPGGPRQFGYDASNRMAQVGKPAQVDATYVYSGAGERVRKTAAGVDTYSLHDAAGRWIGDYDSNGAPIQQAIWLGDLPVGLTMTVPASAGQTQQKLFHLQPDMLGTPRVAVDPYRGTQGRGTVVWTWDLEGEAFGNEPTQQDPDGDGVAFKLDMRFPGQRYDAATGLNYNYFRDYEAGTGRYVQSDPIGLDGGTSTYGYVAGMPISAVDSHGLVASILVRFGYRFLMRNGLQTSSRSLGNFQKNQQIARLNISAASALALYGGVRASQLGLITSAAHSPGDDDSEESPYCPPIPDFAPAPPPEGDDDSTQSAVPQRARDVVRYAKSNNGAAQPGYYSSPWANRPKIGHQQLPSYDKSGNLIRYTEYDVRRYTGFGRGAERVVIGSDGRSYYTANHYRTFVRIK